MKKYTIIFLFIPTILYSQVSGKIIDSNTKEPLIGATIQSFNNEGEMIEGVMSNVNGQFNLKNNSIKRINISFIGFEDKIVENKDQILIGDLGDILMIEKPISIDEISVVASLRKQDAVTETILITDSIRKGSISAAHMLNKILGIQTDWISENIKVGNESNVPIIVNGNEVPASYAMSLNPKRIRKVEIMRHPIGRYSDYPVIINLELIQDYKGWDIAHRIMGTVSLLNKHTNKEIAAIDINWTKNKWNIYFSTEYNRTNWYSASSYIKKYGKDYSEKSSEININNPNQEKNSNMYKISFGLEYNINKHHSISTQIWRNTDCVENRETLETSIHEFQNTLSNNILIKNNYKSSNTAVGIFYHGSFNDKLYLTSDVLYNAYRINEYRAYTENQYSSEKHPKGIKDYIRYNIQGRYSLSSTWSVQIDNSLILRKYMNYSDSSNTVDYNSSEFREKIGTSIDFHPNQNVNIQFGGGLLYVKNTTKSDSQETTSFLPYFKLYWSPLKYLTVNANVYNYIDYPNLDQLSTFVWQVDRFVQHQGNPDLKARVMNYVEIQLRLKNNFKITYMNKFSKNEISAFYKSTNNGKFIETLTNSNYHHSYIGLEFDHKTKNNIFFNFLTNYQWYNLYQSSIDKNKGYTYTVDTRAMYELPHIKTKLLASYYLRYDMLPLLQGKEYNQEEMLGIGINKSFLKDKLPITLMVSIPTQVIPKRTYRKIKIPNLNIERYEDARVNSFVISLNMRYNISNNKVRKSSKELIIDKEK